MFKKRVDVDEKERISYSELKVSRADNVSRVDISYTEFSGVGEGQIVLQIF